MVWPAQSPDLNPIEHAWFYLKRKLAEYEESPKGIEELWRRTQEEWNKIPAEVCQGLIESMPRRVEAVLKSQRRIYQVLIYTKYPDDNQKSQNCSNVVMVLQWPYLRHLLAESHDPGTGR